MFAVHPDEIEDFDGLELVQLLRSLIYAEACKARVPLRGAPQFKPPFGRLAVSKMPNALWDKFVTKPIDKTAPRDLAARSDVTFIDH